MNRQRTVRYTLSLVLTGLFLFHAAGVLRIPLLDSLESAAYDARIRLLPPGHPGTRVVIVAIDEASLSALGRWPWPRDRIAAIVDSLFDHYRITAMGFDIVFAEPSPDPGRTGETRNNEDTGSAAAPSPDRLLANSLDGRSSVLGYVFGSGTRKGSLPAPAALLDSPAAMRIPFVEADSFTANIAMLQAHALGAGFFDNPLVDDDGVYRRLPLLQRYEDAVFESLPLALARSALGSPNLEFVVSASPTAETPPVLEWLATGELIIPVDQHASVLIPYGSVEHGFSYVSAIDVLNRQAGRESLEGRVVLFGPSAPGLQDLHATPVHPAMPGVEIHASVVQGILDQSILHRPDFVRGLEFVSLLLLGIVLTLLFTRLSPAVILAGTAAAALLLIALNLALWSRLQLVAPLAPPLAFVLLMYSLHTSYGLLVETRTRRRLVRLLGQYVPAELVDAISTTDRTKHLDGETREMSVLFADIHDFTTMAEDMDPKELGRLVNAVLDPVSQAIHQHRGTIDKYMGDAVMAFWGAPADAPDHSNQAVRAGLDMVGRIRRLAPSFQAKRWPAIRIGIGINSGPMSAGNKGSSLRADYTVVGDAVNLGSRLERLTRVYGVDIIVGETTRNAVTGIEFRELDRVRVKGKAKPVVIYEPLGPVETLSESDRSALQSFNHAVRYYRERRWDAAAELLRELNENDPQRRLYALYLERIAHFRQHPPPKDWDGTFTQTSK